MWCAALRLLACASACAAAVAVDAPMRDADLVPGPSDPESKSLWSAGWEAMLQAAPSLVPPPGARNDTGRTPPPLLSGSSSRCHERTVGCDECTSCETPYWAGQRTYCETHGHPDGHGVCVEKKTTEQACTSENGPSGNECMSHTCRDMRCVLKQQGEGCIHDLECSSGACELGSSALSEGRCCDMSGAQCGPPEVPTAPREVAG